MKKNDIFTTEITAVSSEGLGVAKPDGLTVFIPYTVPGDKVCAKIVKDKKSYAFGKVLEILEPSADRVVPPCSVFGKCGGCSLMHIDYKKQLEIKRQTVCDALKRIGKIQCEVAPVFFMENPFRYRNKVQVPLSMENNNVLAGFYANHSHRVVPFDDCLLQTEKNAEIISSVCKWMDTNFVIPYNEETGSGTVRHIFIREGFETGEVMVCLVCTKKSLPAENELAEILQKLNVSTLVININSKKSNVILGDKNRVIYGDGYIHEIMDGLKFKISPNSFFQVNPTIAKELYKKSVSFISPEDTVFDLYCGTGSISLFVARIAKKVIGVEIVENAIKDANYNARLNGIENAEFYCGDADEVFPKLLSDGISADVAIIDPPRKGCGKEVLDSLVKLNPKKIIYVSCNCASMARDINYLSEFGFRAGTVYPYDQFPHTEHIESVVCLSKTI